MKKFTFQISILVFFIGASSLFAQKVFYKEKYYTLKNDKIYQRGKVVTKGLNNGQRDSIYTIAKELYDERGKLKPEYKKRKARDRYKAPENFWEERAERMAEVSNGVSAKSAVAEAQKTGKTLQKEQPVATSNNDDEQNVEQNNSTEKMNSSEEALIVAEAEKEEAQAKKEAKAERKQNKREKEIRNKENEQLKSVKKEEKTKKHLDKKQKATEKSQGKQQRAKAQREDKRKKDKIANEKANAQKEKRKADKKQEKLVAKADKKENEREKEIRKKEEAAKKLEEKEKKNRKKQQGKAEKKSKEKKTDKESKANKKLKKDEKKAARKQDKAEAKADKKQDKREKEIRKKEKEQRKAAKENKKTAKQLKKKEKALKNLEKATEALATAQALSKDEKAFGTVYFKINKEKTKVDSLGFIKLYFDLINNSNKEIIVLKPDNSIDRRINFFTTKMECLQIVDSATAYEAKHIKIKDEDYLTIVPNSKSEFFIDGVHQDMLACSSEEVVLKIEYNPFRYAEKAIPLSADEQKDFRKALNKISKQKIESENIKFKLRK